MSFVLKPESRSYSGENENGLHMNGQDSLVQPLLTDFYQISMTYAYWKATTHDHYAVFDLFFRKNPFHGEFTVFAGLEDCLRFAENFRFSESDLEYLESIMPKADKEFFEYLKSIDGNCLKISAVPEGTVVFPKVPLITVEGPLAVCQLMETTFLNLVNYASLVATNAARFRQAAGEKKQLLEFGLRRAQGPNGGLTASKYCYVGGFDGTSNVLAGKLYGIPVKGTQAHSFVCSFSPEDKEDELTKDNGKIEEETKKKSIEDQFHLRMIKSTDGTKEIDLYALSLEKRKWLMEKIDFGVQSDGANIGELMAFVAYAISFPDTNLALIDTYDVLKSGIINFLAVTIALNTAGYRSLGCRIDSGDLAYLSKELRNIFHKVAALDSTLSWISDMCIVASNDINEETIMSLNEQGHEINAYGVGTHLVTCQKQPALGCVYKLVAIANKPKIKLSQEVSKITIPCKKAVYRMYGKSGYSILDLMALEYEVVQIGKDPILCRHPFEESKRADVFATRIERLQKVFFENGKITQELPTLKEIRDRVKLSLNSIRRDHRRYLNPTPYKVSVSQKLYNFLHSMWLNNAPVGRLE